MTTTDGVTIPADVMEPLEALMFEAIGITAIALSVAAAGELTLPQWRALVIIGRSEMPRVGDIAAAMGMSLPSTSRLVRRLERSGLVVTMRDESDRRATLVKLTDGGRLTRENVVKHRRRMLEEAVGRRASRLPRGLAPGLTEISQALKDYE